jgi:hypothetical protein
LAVKQWAVSQVLFTTWTTFSGPILPLSILTTNSPERRLTSAETIPLVSPSADSTESRHSSHIRPSTSSTTFCVRGVCAHSSPLRDQQQPDSTTKRRLVITSSPHRNLFGIPQAA